MQGKLLLDNNAFEIHVQDEGQRVEVNGTTFQTHLQQNEQGYLIRVGEDLVQLSLDDEVLGQFISNSKTPILVDGKEVTASFQAIRKQQLASAEGSSEPDEGSLLAFMPGTILRVDVEPGQICNSGDVILILEAMKMENEIKAPCDCQIDSIHVEPGKSVNKGELLIQLTPLAGE